ncbi:MAG: SURF1 family protein [Gammaproteobacteria bacterium]
MLALLLKLGFWQMERAHAKERLQAAFAASSATPAVPIAALDPSDPATHYRRVILQGRYDTEHQILLDNQIHQGQPGYHVYTPFIAVGMVQSILINRGWLPLGRSRQDVPDVTVTDTTLTLAGRIGQPANPGIRLASPTGESPWPRIVQYLDYAELSAALGYPLVPAVILLDPDSPQGYLRDWRPSFGGFGPERHYAYAVQWFALALTLMVIVVVLFGKRARSAC